jgi:hypothetical protein
MHKDNINNNDKNNSDDDGDDDDEEFDYHLFGQYIPINIKILRKKTEDEKSNK